MQIPPLNPLSLNKFSQILLNYPVNRNTHRRRYKKSHFKNFDTILNSTLKTILIIMEEVIGK
jgi:hypothetical protein